MKGIENKNLEGKKKTAHEAGNIMKTQAQTADAICKLSKF